MTGQPTTADLASPPARGLPASAVPAPPMPVAADAGRPWCRATRVLVVLAVGWLAFSLAGLVFSGRWWLWLLPDLAPPITGIAVPALILTAVPVIGAWRRPLPVSPRWIVILCALLSLAAGIPRAGLNPYAFSAAGGPAGSTGPATTVKLFAWNTEYWDQDDDPRKLLDFLVAQRADIYLLQEHLYWDVNAGLDGARRVNDLDKVRATFAGYTVVADGELLTISRYPVVGHVALGAPAELDDADTGAGPLSRPRPAFGDVFTAVRMLRTDVLVGGQTLSTYNVHLPVQVNLVADSKFFSFIDERNAARHHFLDALTQDVAANANPVVVAGDFNTSPAMADLDQLRERLHDAAEASGDLLPGSWPARFGLAWWRLDWTLTNDRVHVTRYDLRDPLGMSDHRAQDMLLEVTKP
jgi:endonuclease/exonuclease/phosphatase family metal-dependent hydrolase